MVLCTNCNEVSELSIPKGVRIVDYLTQGGKCNQCGCESLQQYSGGKKDKNESSGGSWLKK